MKLSDRFINSLPSGIRPEDVHIIQCAAAIQTDELTEAEKLLVANVSEKASIPLINSEGKPTVMKVVAWMVHEGVNLNRQGFVKEELKALAPSLFKAPDFGVMDWNHSAVALFSDDPKVIGIWYDATFAFDEKAQRWGILATGMMFSWLFQDQANAMLADQERLGNIRFSMACRTNSSEQAKDANGPYTILHNPVFFTVSALDVPPGDEHALGKGSENPEVSADNLRNKLVAVAKKHPWQKLEAAAHKTSTSQEALMEEVIRELTEARVEAERQLAALTERFDTHKSATEVAQAALTEEITELKGKLVVNETKLVEFDDLTAKHAELETTRDALVAEIATAKETITALEAKIVELQAIVDEANAEKAKIAEAEKLNARLEMLPAAYRKAHEAREDEKRTAIEARWVAMSDEDFSAVLEDINAALPASGDLRVSFLDRSNEGPLPNGGTNKESDFTRFIK